MIVAMLFFGYKHISTNKHGSGVPVFQQTSSKLVHNSEQVRMPWHTLFLDLDHHAVGITGAQALAAIRHAPDLATLKLALPFVVKALLHPSMLLHYIP